ncbi:MAG: hypothetical protein JNJ63_12055 [Hyphomonadaceae bacterium]|nr:hypothetical protein [Hyphomonadaceae bacterium]
MLKIVGAGLSRTGTYSLHLALQQLGFDSLHFDEQRLNDVLDGSNTLPDFHCYDDVDAVTDVPTAFFYQELLAAYPGSRAILTVRDPESWWRSINRHFSFYAVSEESRLKHRLGTLLHIPALTEDPYHRFRRTLRNLVYGSPKPREFLYKKKFAEHNALVRATVAADRLLEIDICGGQGWEVLCPFLGVAIPNTPFPHAHVSEA